MKYLYSIPVMLMLEPLRTAFLWTVAVIIALALCYLTVIVAIVLFENRDLVARFFKKPPPAFLEEPQI